MLKEADGYISGEELCRKFQVSRTAVWKVIHQLKEEGYEIQAVRNKGYCLTESADVLSEAELESSIHTRWMGKKVVYLKTVDSTNNLAKKLAEEGCPSGTLVVAEQQTAGKGRLGRAWDSAPETGIWHSLVLRPHVPPASASMITLVAALAVAEAMEQVTGLSPLIKWPNDIVLHGKKVCGILTEMSAEMEQIHYVVVGMGINANTEAFPEELSALATSIYLEKGEKINRSRLIAAVMKAFEHYYEIYEARNDLSDLTKSYEQKLANMGNTVRILDPAGEYEALALGIDHTGALLVKKQDGQTERIFSGEVSVRGIYGYV